MEMKINFDAIFVLFFAFLLKKMSESAEARNGNFFFCYHWKRGTSIDVDLRGFHKKKL